MFDLGTAREVAGTVPSCPVLDLTWTGRATRQGRSRQICSVRKPSDVTARPRWYECRGFGFWRMAADGFWACPRIGLMGVVCVGQVNLGNTSRKIQND